MDFLNNLLLPLSADNLNLLKYILTLSYIIFIPYTAFLAGVAAYSLALETVFRRKKDPFYVKASFEIVERAVLNKNVLIGLGIVPYAAIIFSYTQLLRNIYPSPIFVMLLAFTAYAGGIYYLYVYKHSHFIEGLLVEKVVTGKIGLLDSEERERLERVRSENLKANKRGVILAVLLLYISVLIQFAGTDFAILASSGRQDAGFWVSVLSFRPIIKFFLFIDTSLTISVLGLLSLRSSDLLHAKLMRPGNDLVRTGLITALLCVAGMPVWILVDMYLVPKISLTGTFFFGAAASVVLLFVVLHLLYYLIKGISIKTANYGLFLFILTISLFVIGENSLFGSVARRQILVMASVYDQKVAERNEKTGRGVAVNGQEIFEGRCAACHRFDSKLVGPAYNDVLPKYEGKMDQLTGFILNPVKVDPAYPPMPNQGLKPNEAKAVAEYIMKTYKKS